jgi:hypothetical protein
MPSAPFVMFDLANKNLIMTRTVPEGSISDTKNIIYTEQPIPGRNYQPVSFGGCGNRKIAFTLPVLRRNDDAGNMFILKQFECLRNQSRGFFNFKAIGQFTPTPKVLFQWGANAVPLVYFVSKCDFQHNASFTNRAALPQLTNVSMELTLDEENELYQVEEAFRIMSAAMGNLENTLDAASRRRL